MPKITVIPKQMGRQLLPITVNQDGSINASVSYGFIEVSELPNGEKQTNFAVQSQSTTYITAAEAEAALNTVSEKGESLADLLERAVSNILRTKGVFQD